MDNTVTASVKVDGKNVITGKAEIYMPEWGVEPALG
tara:strand:- start:410 stop:517 length:108 start_codon:yes stop_codon:yes gene_type:complete